jgi:hypothetical protein
MAKLTPEPDPIETKPIEPLPIEPVELSPVQKAVDRKFLEAVFNEMFGGRNHRTYDYTPASIHGRVITLSAEDIAAKGLRACVRDEVDSAVTDISRRLRDGVKTPERMKKMPGVAFLLNTTPPVRVTLSHDADTDRYTLMTETGFTDTDATDPPEYVEELVDLIPQKMRIKQQ